MFCIVYRRTGWLPSLHYSHMGTEYFSKRYKKYSYTMPHTLFLAALCLTLLTVDAEQVVQTAEVDIAANTHHVFTFETPLTATLLKSVSLVNVAQQGSCGNKEVPLSVELAGKVHNPKIGFNNSEWVQFVGTNTSSSVTTVGVTVLNCASRLKAVAVFYTVDPKPVVVSSEPKVIGARRGRMLDVHVPLGSSYVTDVTLRLLNLVNCDDTPFEVYLIAAAPTNATFTEVGDALAVSYDALLQPDVFRRLSVPAFVSVSGLPSTCIANFVVDVDCHHVDIPLTGAPPTAVPTTPWPATTPTPLDLHNFDWAIFFIVLGSGGAVFLVAGAVAYMRIRHDMTRTVVHGVVVQSDVERPPCEASSLLQ